jgi:antitoxin (DNA-binding transcriptional repressor) of toxin-antitoxin stability system
VASGFPPYQRSAPHGVQPRYRRPRGWSPVYESFDEKHLIRLLVQPGHSHHSAIMKTLPAAEVRKHLSSLLKEVQTGAVIAISQGKQHETIAVIIPFEEYQRSRKRKLRTLNGRMKVLFRKDFPMTDSDLIR